VSRLGTSAIAAATGGSSAANETESEAAENAGKSFRIVVPRDDGATRDLARIEAGQEKKLPVPQCDDRGVKLARLANLIRGIGNDRRGLDDELNVVGENGTQENLQRAPQASPLPPKPGDLPKPRQRLAP